MTTIDFYEILGVTRTASVDEVHAAYRKAVKLAHPDVGGTSGLFRLLKEADDTLTDSSRRRTYDRTLDGATPAPDATPRPEPEFRDYPTYVPPRGSSYVPPKPNSDGARSSTHTSRSGDSDPKPRGFAALRPTLIDLITVGLALALLVAQLVIAIAQGGLHWPGTALLGHVPVVGFVLGPAPDTVAALALSIALYAVPAMMLSRKMISPILRDARGHGRPAFAATAIALGLLTVVLLWTPVTWLAILGLFIAFWVLRITWRVLAFFNPS